jgi:hypothetical protein
MSVPPGLGLASVLLVSLALRVALVLGGGQFYWPDESYYDHSRKIVTEALAGDFASVASRLDGESYPLFRIVMLVPASIEYLAGADTRIPALFLAAFSLLNVWLVGRIAKDLGASDSASLLASLLYACSTAAAIFSRHLVPYDVSMTMALGAMHLALTPALDRRRALAAGALAGCAFLTYAGYWTLGGAALTLGVLLRRDWRSRIEQALWSGAGLIGSFAIAVAISQLARGLLLASFISLSGTITQGDMSEGARLPWEYLWHAEHGVLVWWVAACAWVAWTVARGQGTRLLVAGLGGLVFVYGALALFSTALEQFVVYGRLARPMVPFFCLTAAAALEAMRRSGHSLTRAAGVVVTVLLVVQAAVNLAVPLRLTFPNEFRRAAAGGDDERAIWQNARYVYPDPDPTSVPDGYVIAGDAPHPAAYRAYRYEGPTAAQRAALEGLRMRLLLPAAARGTPAEPE